MHKDLQSGLGFVAVVALVIGGLALTSIYSRTVGDANLYGAAVATPAWTQWYDRDNPSGSGDYELLNNLIKSYPSICAHPVNIECQTTTGKSIDETGEVVICDTATGFYCKNSNQPDGKCNYDYRVRFDCATNTSETTCTSACTLGQSTCNANKVLVCGDSNGDGCGEWLNFTSCAAPLTCQYGACVNTTASTSKSLLR